MNNLKMHRKKRKLTLDELAAKEGVCSKGNLCLIEGDKREPKVMQALSIAKALKTTVEKIWGDA